MEYSPPQVDSPSGPAESEPGGTGFLGSPTRTWQWLLLFLLVALIVWLYRPQTEIKVFFPWFLDQVENDNIKSISVRGLEISGELRTPRRYRNPPTEDMVVQKFYTVMQTEAAIEPTIKKLTERNLKNPSDRVLIDVQPPR